MPNRYRKSSPAQTDAAPPRHVTIDHMYAATTADCPQDGSYFGGEILARPRRTEFLQPHTPQVNRLTACSQLRQRPADSRHDAVDAKKKWKLRGSAPSRASTELRCNFVRHRGRVQRPRPRVTNSARRPAHNQFLRSTLSRPSHTSDQSPRQPPASPATLNARKRRLDAKQLFGREAAAKLDWPAAAAGAASATQN